MNVVVVVVVSAYQVGAEEDFPVAVEQKHGLTVTGQYFKERTRILLQS